MALGLVCQTGTLAKKKYFPLGSRAFVAVDAKATWGLAMQRHRVMVSFTKPQRIFHDRRPTPILPGPAAINRVFLTQDHTWGLCFDGLGCRVKVVGQVIDHITIAVAVFRSSPRSMFTPGLSYGCPGEAVEHAIPSMSTQGTVIAAHGVRAKSILERPENGEREC